MTEPALKALLQDSFSTANQKTLLDYLFREGLTIFSQPRILVETTESVQSAKQIGSVALSDGRNLAIIDVSVTDDVQIARNRKGLRDVAAKYVDQNIIHGALVFYHGSKLRSIHTFPNCSNACRSSSSRWSGLAMLMRAHWHD